ncbi:helix-turn-helix domain-containing protein [Candidatus Tokpelaia sp.]|uniref:helix-turn-helix domain-containing protein n=1 Tax=Candidatus Tokpelaia sp. TaxID=2233777 RepID=UPI0012387FDD|nr:helix-turn-helix domain-containing protein [Candidatus Tokpelaia sp.]KAA6405783.1 transcriptional regulator [Candidatus Tokpelaia sp.]
MENIAKRLIEERNRIGFNQTAFARLLGISRIALRNIEAGESVFKIDVLQAAAAVGVDIQYVITGIHSQNTSDIEEKIGYERQAVNIHGNISGVGIMTGGNVRIVQTNIHKTTTKAIPNPGKEHISEEQCVTLRHLVDNVVEAEQALKKSPKTYNAIWSSVNRHCGVSTYRMIKSEDFEKARKYLTMWIGRLMRSKSAPVKTGDAWRKRHYTYIKVNSKSPSDESAVKAYMKRKFKAESLTELDNDQLEAVYRYVAGRKSARK